MNEFENFQIRSWLVNGLTRHVQPRRHHVVAKRLKDASWKNRVVLPVFASAGAAAAILMAGPSAAQTDVSWPEYFSAYEIAALDDPDVISKPPAAFWARQIEKVRGLRREATQDDEVVDPPSIF